MQWAQRKLGAWLTGWLAGWLVGCVCVGVCVCVCVCVLKCTMFCYTLCVPKEQQHAQMYLYTDKPAHIHTHAQTHTRMLIHVCHRIQDGLWAVALVAAAPR